MSDIMKIYITGAQCTGKSTLCKSISEYLLNHQVVSPARAVYKGYTGDAENELEISFKIGRAMKEIFNSDNIISDRFFTDVYAYSSIYGADRLSLKELGCWAKDASFQENSLVCYTPIEFEFKPDGVRYPFHREEVDKLIVSVLYEYGVKYVTVTGELDLRVQKVLSYIEKGFPLKGNGVFKSD